MRSLHRIFLILAVLTLHCTNALSHDDLPAREEEFRHGYQVGFITAIRDAYEGTSMCTKDIPLLEVIQTVGAHSKAKGIPSDQALSAKHITEALSTKYKCKVK